MARIAVKFVGLLGVAVALLAVVLGEASEDYSFSYEVDDDYSPELLDVTFDTEGSRKFLATLHNGGGGGDSSEESVESSFESQEESFPLKLKAASSTTIPPSFSNEKIPAISVNKNENENENQNRNQSRPQETTGATEATLGDPELDYGDDYDYDFPVLQTPQGEEDSRILVTKDGNNATDPDLDQSGPIVDGEGQDEFVGLEANIKKWLNPRYISSKDGANMGNSLFTGILIGFVALTLGIILYALYRGSLLLSAVYKRRPVHYRRMEEEGELKPTLFQQKPDFNI